MKSDSEGYLQIYQAAQDYLKLSQFYGQYLGGLRWSGMEDAIIDESNRPFAFSEMIAEFVEGFASQGRAVSFGYLLHWIDLLQNRRKLEVPAIVRLHKVFTETVPSWSFAGAFAATLSTDVPALPDPPDLESVGKRLRNRAFPIRWFTAQFKEVDHALAPFPLTPQQFEQLIIARLESYREEEVRTWLRTGRGPIKQAERLAEEPPALRSLTRVLADLVQRPRLAGAQPYVTQLVGALTLPPRRFVPQELPVGGYSDIVTRGQVEHLLPTQFALDEVEFLRRYAEKELLYFRREEPPAHHRHEMVVLLDQGVRTWGDVRLVLSAAALALGKQAIRRQTPFFLAASSNGGAIVDPTGPDAEALGELVEASDLSLNPGLALEHTLETPSAVLRDVVLLTHPRSLREEDVLGAARRLGPHDRLFAVALDAHGQVEISEVRHGTAIKLRQFHIDFAPSIPTPPPPRPSAAAPPNALWTGDVETIPFPFRVGTEPHVTHFDFDYAGAWLLTASAQGCLHLWKLDGTTQEMLPRPCRDGVVLKKVVSLTGVSGGFVVIYRDLPFDLMVHYDMVRRHCTNFQPGYDANIQNEAFKYCYVAENHSVVMWSSLSNKRCLIELDSEAIYVFAGDGDLPARARITWSIIRNGKAGWTNRCLLSVTSTRPVPTADMAARGEPAIYFAQPAGSFSLFDMEKAWPTFTPIANGKPCFAHAPAPEAQLAGNTLALRARRIDIGESITLMQYDGTIVREYPVVHATNKQKITKHLLSFDGTRIAMLRSDHRVEVDAIYDRGVPTVYTRVGNYTLESLLYVGNRCVLLNLGSSRQFWHLFDWGSGTLDYHFQRTPLGRRRHEEGSMFPETRQRGPYSPGSTNQWPACCKQDSDRYRSCVRRGRLWFVLDRFGQVAVLDESERVLAMFIAFRDRHAAWLPDGTRVGNLTLSLGAPTPDAAQRIGRRLMEGE